METVETEIPSEHAVHFAVMDRTGDTKHIWDRRKTEQVDAARSLFTTLVRDKKYLAFKVNDKGDRGEQVKEFDSNEERYIFVPPMVGG